MAARDKGRAQLDTGLMLHNASGPASLAVSLRLSLCPCHTALISVDVAAHLTAHLQCPYHYQYAPRRSLPTSARAILPQERPVGSTPRLQGRKRQSESDVPWTEGRARPSTAVGAPSGSMHRCTVSTTSTPLSTAVPWGLDQAPAVGLSESTVSEGGRGLTGSEGGRGLTGSRVDASGPLSRARGRGNAAVEDRDGGRASL